MKRILHYGMSYNLGGIESFLMNLYRNIDRNIVQFDFLAFGNRNIYFEKEILSMGGRVFYITSRRESPVKYWMELKQFFKEHREYAAFHMHVNTCSTIAPLIDAYKCHIPTVLHSHNEWNGSSKITKISHAMQRGRAKKYTNHRMACSDIAGKYMFGDESFDVIFNAIDIDDYIFRTETRNLVRQQYGLDDKFVVGHIGRFFYQKNHTFLIDIFEKIHEQNQNAVLFLVGEGELMDDMSAKVAQLGLSDDVIFAGIQNNVPELLMAMDAFVFPSHFEGLGIVLIEAQASDLPCFASADVIPKSVKVSDHLLFLPLQGDAQRWADKILSYPYGERTDNRKLIEHAGYDIGSMAKKMQSFYLNVEK